MNELAYFHEIMNWYRESGEENRLDRPDNNNGRYVKAGLDKSNEYRCLNCKRVIPQDQLSPFCSNTCMDSWDKGGAERWRQIERAKKNPDIMQHFSEIFAAIREERIRQL